MNNDTPATTPAPFACFRCNDGQTPLYCLNCAGELLKATPQPTHSAQEAAELLCKADELLRLAVDKLNHYARTNAADCNNDYPAVQSFKDQTKAFLARPRPWNTPTQSQQPPLSPGSGETMREALKEAIDMAERLVQSMDYLGTGSDSQAALKEQMADEDRIEVLRRALAQPATPPLPTKDKFAEAREELASLAAIVEHERNPSNRPLGPDEQLAQSPPLTSGEDFYRMVDNFERIIAEGITSGYHPKTIAMKLVSPAPIVANDQTNALLAEALSHLTFVFPMAKEYAALHHPTGPMRAMIDDVGSFLTNNA